MTDEPNLEALASDSPNATLAEAIHAHVEPPQWTEPEYDDYETLDEMRERQTSMIGAIAELLADVKRWSLPTDVTPVTSGDAEVEMHLRERADAELSDAALEVIEQHRRAEVLRQAAAAFDAAKVQTERNMDSFSRIQEAMKAEIKALPKIDFSDEVAYEMDRFTLLARAASTIA